MNPNTAPYLAIPSTIGEGPKISMSSRHPEAKGPTTPGPEYIPPNIGEDASKIAMSFRHNNEKPNTNPGPGTYTINPRFAVDANKYTIKNRNFTEHPNTNPAPDAYSPDYNVTKESPKKISIHIKPGEKKPEQRPGYYNLPSTLGGPYITIGLKEDLNVLNL
ncbi:hypothetical protein TRFO_31975 [Tritrichomonas foetus]|uniref:Uncharacterized protein n=1 Tax=Tritrichomonas foetus TaxID=1144522 RepID=A0A1J4JS60_9EUKA|nr:hypothetical protein TRFO_31975 [Tritrichomonas foetus]|eukprot:OHT01264.1 hypothetical protein TRFO_31975 [Tritrichomonas foetus]